LVGKASRDCPEKETEQAGKQMQNSFRKNTYHWFNASSSGYLCPANPTHKLAQNRLVSTLYGVCPFAIWKNGIF
jgi:hypothetical protein